ncbi:response regulator [Salinarimonas soli]|uniref:Response regulator n=1 Tax=Salinarimonas soli TaxID=1638099 RepID=A0A5B2VCS7_9HYPH|nr:response regulator [Salinarimonas soli]KAA2236486.1 response regulator [Salinarimonas soli]
MSGSERVVLCVEDDAIVRMFVTDALADAGFHVLEAGSAAEALVSLAARGDVHALVTDVDMPPGMNGFALAHRVSEQWPGIAVVVLSGCLSPSPGDLPPGSTFLEKPVSEARLIAEVTRACGARGAPQAEDWNQHADAA